MLTTIASYRMITADIDSALSRTARQPNVARESEYYLENIGNVKTIDDFLGDYRLYSYAMKAFGLEDMTYAKAFMRKVLTEGIDSDHSFANKLVDKRYRDFAETFNFARHGETATVFTRTQQGTVDRYVRQVMEEDAGQQNEAVRLALYFERKAPSITSAYAILADPALQKVVQTSLGLPESVGMMDVDKLADLISSRIDLEDFQDPEKLAGFLTRFTAMWDVHNPRAATSSPALLIGGSNQIGISADLLMSMQSFKLGGR